MVLQPVHAGAAKAGGWILATPLEGKPDLNRIAGITGTLLLNAGAFMLLLVPLSSPPPKAIAEAPEMTTTWLPREKPIPPPPPVPLPVTAAKPEPRPATIPVQTSLPTPVEVPVLVDQGIPVESITSEVIPDSTVAIDPPAATAAIGSSLEYTSAPAPAYPRAALLEGREGTVVLRVTVGVDGRPRAVSIERGSGHRDFDDAARREVLRRWNFHPAVVDGQAVEAVGLVPIDFRLG